MIMCMFGAEVRGSCCGVLGVGLIHTRDETGAVGFEDVFDVSSWGFILLQCYPKH